MPSKKNTRALLPSVLAVLAVLASVSAFVVFAPACTPGRCSAQCAADPEPSVGARQSCEDGVAPVPACQNEHNALRDCTDGRTVCGRDDRTDVGATTQVILKECGPQLKAYTDCASVPR